MKLNRPEPETLENILCEKYPNDFKSEDFLKENKNQLNEKIKRKMVKAIGDSLKKDPYDDVIRTLDFSDDLVFWSNHGKNLLNGKELIVILENIFGEKYEDLKNIIVVNASEKNLKIFPNINQAFPSDKNKGIKIHNLCIDNNPALNEYRLETPIIFKVSAENTALKELPVSIFDMDNQERTKQPSPDNCKERLC